MAACPSDKVRGVDPSNIRRNFSAPIGVYLLYYSNCKGVLQALIVQTFWLERRTRKEAQVVGARLSGESRFSKEEFEGLRASGFGACGFYITLQDSRRFVVRSKV